MAYFRAISRAHSKSKLKRLFGECVHHNSQTNRLNFGSISVTRKFICNQTIHDKVDLYELEQKIVAEKLWKKYLHCEDVTTLEELCKDFTVIEKFLTEEEENSIYEEIEPYMKRLRYEFDHWDNAIHGFRETERKQWNEKNKLILQRVRNFAFPPDVSQLAYVHVLDVAKEGYIKPHVDSVKFCGDVIAGLCLLSPCVMRLVSTKDNTKYGDVLLERRSLYIMKNVARFDYTHEVLKEEESFFKGQKIPRDRRISVICRNEPIIPEKT